VFVNLERKKTKCGLFAEHGRRQRRLCRELRAITLGNSGKIFPAQVFPALLSVVARGARQRIFFKKNKNRLCRQPLPGTLGTRFSKKIEKQPLPTALPGALGTGFFKKIKLPSLPTARARGRRERRF
jgi:hypothetical protein